MDYKNVRVAELKALARERELRGYSRLRKVELIALLQNNLQPRTRLPTAPRRPTPPPPQARRAPQVEAQSFRFRPDRPRPYGPCEQRQPELLRQLNERQLIP